MSIPSPTSARLLDAGYRVICIAANLFALYVVRASGKTSARYPQEHYFLEPLYGILQALVVLAAALIWQPLSLIREGFIELSGGVFFPGSKKEQIRQAVKKAVPEGHRIEHVRIRKIGIRYNIRIQLDGESDDPLIPSRLLKSAQEIRHNLRGVYDDTTVEFVIR